MNCDEKIRNLRVPIGWEMWVQINLLETSVIGGSAFIRSEIERKIADLLGERQLP
jgi:hypothetical protein